jgi:hypothetical protein
MPARETIGRASSASIFKIAIAQCHWIGHEEKEMDVADWLAACNLLYLSIRSLILNNHQSHRRNISRRGQAQPEPRTYRRRRALGGIDPGIISIEHKAMREWDKCPAALQFQCFDHTGSALTRPDSMIARKAAEYFVSRSCRR